MKKNKVVRAFAIMVAVLTAVTMSPFLGMSNASAEENDGKRLYNDYMRTKAVAQYDDEAMEPYGYGVDVPFYLNKQSEVLFYQTNSESSGEITTFFDGLKSASTDDVLKGTKTTAMKAPPAKLKQAYYVQAVAFDPNGTKRDDHIAFIGIYREGNTAKCYAWVYDTKNRKWSSEFDVGKIGNYNCNWMITAGIGDHEAANFVSITAGDYNGDGKDTLVAFASFNGEEGYSTFQLECKSGPSLGYPSGVEQPEGWALKHNKCNASMANSNMLQTRMGCELDTGDINGDGLDDLVALTYIGNYKETGEDGPHFQTYFPMVKATYGKRQSDPKINSTRDYEEVTAHWTQGDWYNNQVCPGLSVGDINNDGKDEIVTAGVRCETKRKTSPQTYTVTAHEMHDTEMFVTILNSEEEHIYNGVLNLNNWTKSGFYKGDNYWTKLAVQCAAINGPGNPDMIFISGTLYNYDSKNNKLNAVHTPELFNISGDNLTSKSSTNMFVQSTAAGNFDGNKQGYEQIAFTTSAKTSGSRNYDYLRGVIGGKNYNNTIGQAREYYSTAENRMNDNYAWPGRGKDNISGDIGDKKGLNCIVVGCDCDNDGYMARYKEKCMTYADPEVICVLQAPPYFKQVKDYLTDSSSTSYKITEEYAFESSKSDSVSYGVGVVAGMETPAFQMELTAGYALDWSQEFTNGLKETIYKGWNAKYLDLVVVQRTPVVCYTYQLQEKDGSWDDEYIVVSIPCEPDYQQMNVDEYNEFAKYYNTQVGKKLTDFHKLGTLNNKWLGHEGEPQKYIKWTNSKFKTDSAYKIIQTTPMNFGHNSESVEWGRDTGESVGVTESMSHGFTYDATFAAGPNVGAASLTFGVSTSLQYMTGSSTTTTQTQEKGISCEVNGLMHDAPASLHPRDYNFSFKMARWPSGLKRYVNDKAEDVPVYGYALSGVTVPEELIGVSVDDQLAAAHVDEAISELPEVAEITLADEEAVGQARADYDALSKEAKTLINETDLKAKEDRIAILKAGGLDLSKAKVQLSKTSYTYNGKVQKPTIKTVGGYTLIEGLDYTKTYSNASSKKPGTYTVTLTGMGLCSGTAKATYKIGKATNTLKAAGKTATVKYSAVKKANKTLKRSAVISITGAKGTVTYAKAGGSWKIKIDKKTGKVTVKKGIKKGTYKVKVKVRAAGNTYYKASPTKKITFIIKVK